MQIIADILRYGGFATFVKYFPEESANITDINVKEQTIKNMLMMSTAKVAENCSAHHTHQQR